MMVVIAIAGAREARRAAVDAVTVRSVAAIVERRATPPRISARTLKAQLARLTKLEKLGLTVLPVRFGTVVQTTAELRALLAPQADSLGRALVHVRGRRQMTVRLRGARTAPSRASGAAYIAGLARAARLPEADGLRRAVEGLVVDERVDATPRAGFAGAVHHLVDARDVGAYRAAVAAAQKKSPRTLVASGPMMPFAFTPDPAAGSEA
ncbi:MAG: GvpL/GvpF family gas vesicle protein [Acidobacteriota bacterium]|nr:GvpL/GvpF family gas vesicle protein [Acidobacteriota bacterium]